MLFIYNYSLMAPILESPNSFLVHPKGSKTLHCIINGVKTVGREYLGSHLECLCSNLILIPENLSRLRMCSSYNIAHAQKANGSLINGVAKESNHPLYKGYFNMWNKINRVKTCKCIYLLLHDNE